MRIPVLWHGGLHIMTSFNFSYLIRALLPNTVTLGVRMPSNKSGKNEFGLQLEAREAVSKPYSS